MSDEPVECELFDMLSAEVARQLKKNGLSSCRLPAFRERIR